MSRKLYLGNLFKADYSFYNYFLVPWSKHPMSPGRQLEWQLLPLWLGEGGLSQDTL